MLNPATLALIVQGIQMAIAAAPKVIEIAQKGKEFITSLFKAGLISKTQQDTTHAAMEAWVACLTAIHQTPEFEVEADPV